MNRPPHIIVVGSANVDLTTFTDQFPRPGETIFGREFHLGFGGKGAATDPSALGGVLPGEVRPGVIRLALDILARKATPPAIIIRHLLITPENVDRFYPNDTLMGLGRTAPRTAV